jgi:hypothetical protein
MARRNLLALAILLIVSSVQAWSQANVNEGSESAFIYVNGVTGSDSNPGSQAYPLRSLTAAAGRALSNSQNGVGTRVIIAPGTYRESFSLSGTGATAPITLEAATPGTVIVSGAQLYTGWQPAASNPQVYVHSWPNRFGYCSSYAGTTMIEAPIVRRREMIAVNGTPLTQVLAPSQMAPGTFFVDESNGQAYLLPAAGTDMSTATVEVASLPVLLVVRKSNVVVRGITFQYANSCRGTAAVFVLSASNVLMEGDRFQWNNAQGLNISNRSSNFTVQNSTANFNGDTGFQAVTVDRGLWQSDEASYNNWRGAQAGYYFFNSGGGHFFMTHNQTFSGFNTYFNHTYGTHFDTDNANIVATSMNASQNLMNGLFIEKNEGPFNVSNGTYCSNNIAAHPQWIADGGISIRNSTFVTLTGNLIVNNGRSQITIQGQRGGLAASNWQTGQTYNLITSHLTMALNVMSSTTGQVDFRDGYLGGTDWSTFVSTLNSNSNTWSSALPNSTFVVPTPRYGTNLDLAGWRSVTRQDTSSQFASVAAPTSAACAPVPEVADYWLTVAAPVVSVAAGGQASFGLQLVPVGYTGPVSLQLDGVSQIGGAVAHLSAATAAVPATLQVALSTGGSTPPGTYPITVIASNGSITHTVTVYVVVH